MVESFLNDRVMLYAGDCMDVLARLEECSIDACVSDPPYHLISIVKRFGSANAAPAKSGKTGAYKRAASGFMGKQWDGVDAPKLDAGLGHWLAGFADGEGCFTTRRNGKGYVCEFIIHVRADDAGILRAIHAATEIGDIRGPSDRGDGGAPMVKWIVARQEDCAKLVQIFRTFPLRAKKKRDFEIWESAVREWIDHEPGTSWDDLAAHAELLSAVKDYGSSFHPSQLFHYRWAKQVFRVLKPGGHLVAFCGTRTYHRLAAAIEDAGFEIRDQLAWCYGSGFPKSHDVSKALDKREGHWRGRAGAVTIEEQVAKGTEYERTPKGYPITAAAAAAGWGTALKPAWEPIVFARKPLIGTVADNWLRHGTGPINIEACKVGEEPRVNEPMGTPQNSYGGYGATATATATATVGRWPANIVSDGSEPELRYFYSAKADADDRIGSKHPTVKPVDLMQWLVRLVTPKGGLVLDPFAGTGTTGEAAWREGMRAVLIEREAEYQEDIRRRMKLCLAGPDEKRRESLKARGLVDDAGPLFGGNNETRRGGQTDLRSLRGRKIGPIGLKV